MKRESGKKGGGFRGAPLSRKEFDEAQRTHWLWSGLYTAPGDEDIRVHKPTAGEASKAMWTITYGLAGSLFLVGRAGSQDKGSIWGYAEVYAVAIFLYALMALLILKARKWASRKDKEMTNMDKDGSLGTSGT